MSKKGRKELPQVGGFPDVKPEVSFEEALARLEALVERLEEGKIPLEESLLAYTEGTHLVRHCLERLEKAEATLRELSETSAGFRLRSSSVEPSDRDGEGEVEGGEDWDGARDED